MKKKLICSLAISVFGIGLFAQDFNGLEMNLGNLSRLSNAETRSISAENFTGEKGKGGMAVPALPYTRNVNNASEAARDLGQGWKVNPYVEINPGETLTIAEIEGPGAIQHIWMAQTRLNVWRWTIMRIYWDDEKTPSVECPIADFFCCGWDKTTQVTSLPICVNPMAAFNSYWCMPFRKKCKITIENICPDCPLKLYYQVDYSLTSVPKDAAYFHAQFRRTRYNETSDFTVVDGIKGKGHFVGVYMAIGITNNHWWGEGEMKFFIDGDKKFPTICTTGLEDYFGGSHGFEIDGKYVTYSTPYTGFCQIIKPEGTWTLTTRVGLYRWHIMDPVRFTKDFKATIQDLGWRRGERYLQQHSDMSAASFWYQAEPHAPFPEFPSWRNLENY